MTSRGCFFVPIVASALPGTLNADDGSDEPVVLSQSEERVLLAVAEGLSNREAAKRLGISAHTVKFHVQQIGAKLGVTNRIASVVVAISDGLIDLQAIRIERFK